MCWNWRELGIPLRGGPQMVTWLSPSKSFLISGARSPLQTYSDHTFKEELPSFWILPYISVKALSLSHIIFYTCVCGYCFPPPKKDTSSMKTEVLPGLLLYLQHQVQCLTCYSH